MSDADVRRLLKQAKMKKASSSTTPKPPPTSLPKTLQPTQSSNSKRSLPRSETEDKETAKKSKPAPEFKQKEPSSNPSQAATLASVEKPKNVPDDFFKEPDLKSAAEAAELRLQKELELFEKEVAADTADVPAEQVQQQEVEEAEETAEKSVVLATEQQKLDERVANLRARAKEMSRTDPKKMMLYNPVISTRKQATPQEAIENDNDSDDEDDWRRRKFR
jgi:hypothetical protein